MNLYFELKQIPALAVALIIWAVSKASPSLAAIMQCWVDGHETNHGERHYEVCNRCGRRVPQ